MNAFLRKKNLRLPLPQNNEGGVRSIIQKIIIGFVVLALCIGALNLFSSPIKNALYQASAPISNTFWLAGESASGFFGSFIDTKDLAHQNETLEYQNQQLLTQVSSLQAALQADQAIQSVIQNTQADKFNLAVAQTIGFDSTQDVILINKGSLNGIKQNMPVISSTKVLFGKVIKVYKNYSQVMLISHKESVVDVQVLNEDITQPLVSGVVKGSGNLSLYLDLVPSESEITPENVLITSGLEGVFPKNLLVGKITSNDKNDLKPFQTAKIQPFFDVKNVENVFVITDYKHE